MINYSAVIFSFIGGWFLHKYKEKIVFFIRHFLFLLRNYKNIYGNSHYNEFFEERFSNRDFERGDSFDE